MTSGRDDDRPFFPRISPCTAISAAPIADLPERAASGQDSRLGAAPVDHVQTPEEAVVLHTLLPEVLAVVTRREEEVHCVLVVALGVRQAAL